MLVGIYTDAHFAVASSILNGTAGYKYSARLDMLVDSFKWMYETFESEGVELIFNGGDLIDSDFIKARESSALAEALSYGGKIPEYHIVGNHEKEDKASKYTSLSLLDKNRKITVISEPTKIDNTFSVIPYTRDLDYIDLEPLKNKVLVSHIDYEGMSLGKITLNSGLNMQYACNYFDLILNGHIHAPATYHDKIMNIGAMVGHGFDDNYSVCYPSIMILDTETMKTRRIINPHSALFLKSKVGSVAELIKYLKTLSNLPNPKCLKIEVPYLARDEIRDYLESQLTKYNIVASRISSKVENSSVLNQSKEEIVKLQGYESGASAMKKYVDIQNDDGLPAPKSKMMDFVEKYLK